MIIGFSGKKQSGKNTATNFCIGSFLWSQEIIEGSFYINKNGQLVVSDLMGDTSKRGILDMDRQDPHLQNWLKQNVYSVCKMYSYADCLKDVCINILGLSYEQCYGTDEQKNSLTHLLWEDMPGVITPNTASGILCDASGNGSNPNDIIGWHGLKVIVHEPGQMTAREVMQYIGTEIFRKINPEVWVEATIRRIQKEKPMFAIITDIRFVNEVLAVQKNGGIVIRLTRHKKEKDIHTSETALDNFDAFDFIIQNDKMSIAEQNAAIADILKKSGIQLCI